MTVPAKLIYRCGHTAQPPRFRGDVEAQARQLIAFEEKVGALACSGCFKKQHAAKNSEAAIANKKRGLPPLRGTANEIAWAETLRSDFVAELALTEEAARGACGACLDAFMWIDLHKKGFAGKGLLEEFQRWGRVVEENLKAGLPELEVVAGDEAALQLIEDRRLHLRELGEKLKLERRVVLEAMARLETTDWFPLLPLRDELCLTLLLHESALLTYFELLHRRELLEEEELLFDG